MEKYKLDKDITVYCITAKSFPEGIMEAHQQLHALVKFSLERNYYGISRPNKNGKIIYKAAVTELNKDELKDLHLEEFIIRKGNYLSIIIKDYMQDITAIGKAFDNILKDERIDPVGACVEWYFNEKDVQCMVRTV